MKHRHTRSRRPGSVTYLNERDLMARWQCDGAAARQRLRRLGVAYYENLAGITVDAKDLDAAEAAADRRD